MSIANMRLEDRVHALERVVAELCERSGIALPATLERYEKPAAPPPCSWCGGQLHDDKAEHCPQPELPPGRPCETCGKPTEGVERDGAALCWGHGERGGG